MENYLDTAWQVSESDLEGATSEECFKEGYSASQDWNTLPISDATYNKSDDLVLHVVKTRRKAFLSYKYEYFIAYYVDNIWYEVNTNINIEEGNKLKVIAWKSI